MIQGWMHMSRTKKKKKVATVVCTADQSNCGDQLREKQVAREKENNASCKVNSN